MFLGIEFVVYITSGFLQMPAAVPDAFCEKSRQQFRLYFHLEALLCSTDDIIL